MQQVILHNNHFSVFVCSRVVYSSRIFQETCAWTSYEAICWQRFPFLLLYTSLLCYIYLQRDRTDNCLSEQNSGKARKSYAPSDELDEPYNISRRTAKLNQLTWGLEFCNWLFSFNAVVYEQRGNKEFL